MASSKVSQKKQSSKSSSKGGKQRPASAPSQSEKRRAQDSEPPQDARPQKKRRRTTAESSDEEDSEVQLPQKDGSDVEHSNAGEDEDESETSSSDGSSSDEENDVVENTGGQKKAITLPARQKVRMRDAHREPPVGKKNVCDPLLVVEMSAYLCFQVKGIQHIHQKPLSTVNKLTSSQDRLAARQIQT
jgi:hypothetical protein